MDTRKGYSPYGYRNSKTVPVPALSFNGQLFQAVLEGYALGNGHRIYSPRLMRFFSPDALSPFLKGGINAYAYCLNDPVNGQDPSGKWTFFKSVAQATNRLATQVSSRYKLLTQARGPTNNQYWNMSNELGYAKEHVKKSTTVYTVISSKNGFDQLEPGLNHKFVFTKERRLAVFSSADDSTMPSHGSLAEYSGLGFGIRGLGEEVISAGYIVIGDGGHVFLNNYSGHFQPRFETLVPVQEYVEGLGVQVTLVRSDLWTSP